MKSKVSSRNTSLLSLETPEYQLESILHSELILNFFQTSRIFRAGPNVGPRGPGFIFKNTNFILPFFKKKYLNYNYFNANFNFLRFVFWKWSPILYIQCKSLETGECLSIRTRIKNFTQQIVLIKYPYRTSSIFRTVLIWGPGALAKHFWNGFCMNNNSFTVTSYFLYFVIFKWPPIHCCVSFFPDNSVGQENYFK